jgi:hypothetical protein
MRSLRLYGTQCDAAKKYFLDAAFGGLGPGVKKSVSTGDK